MIMELMERGDLKTVLRDSRPKVSTYVTHDHNTDEIELCEPTELA